MSVNIRSLKGILSDPIWTSYGSRIHEGSFLVNGLYAAKWQLGAGMFVHIIHKHKFMRL
jgi:hypothetical protein